MNDEDLAKITTTIDGMLLAIGREDHALRDALVEKIREYGQARYDQGFDAGAEAYEQ